MAKVRVAVLGTAGGKSVLIDPTIGNRVAALETSVRSLSTGSVSAHRNLSGLQTGDDHPQYTMWAAAERIKAPWSFDANTRWLDSREVQFGTDGDMVMLHNGTNGGIFNNTGPFELSSDAGLDLLSGSGAVNIGGATNVSVLSSTADVIITAFDQVRLNPGTDVMINGVTLTEFIEDAVGLGLVVDTTSIDWTYDDVAGTLEANVVEEWVEDLVGAMVLDTATIDLSYDDGAGTIQGSIIADSVTNTLLANMAESTIKGRAAAAGTGDPTDLTAAQVVTLIGSSLFANPSATIGLAAVNGSAGTAMRSDAAPALSQAIAPTWTGIHTFTQNTVSTFAGSSGTPNILVSAAAPNYGFFETDAAANNARWDIRVSNEQLLMRVLSDDGSTGTAWWTVDRTGNTVDAIGITATNTNFAGNFSLTQDNNELRLGAGSDLRLYHNGTDSVVENDTGNLILRVGGELSLDEVSTAATATAGARTLPANPQDFLVVIINGTSRKIPYYAT